MKDKFQILQKNAYNVPSKDIPEFGLKDPPKTEFRLKLNIIKEVGIFFSIMYFDE